MIIALSSSHHTSPLLQWTLTHLEPEPKEHFYLPVAVAVFFYHISRKVSGAGLILEMLQCQQWFHLDSVFSSEAQVTGMSDIAAPAGKV